MSAKITDNVRRFADAAIMKHQIKALCRRYWQTACWTKNGKINFERIIPNTNDTGCEEQRKSITNGEKFFAPKCSSWWETEPGVGRVVDGLPDRVDRLKGLGNAIVPQVAYEIFKAVECVHWHGA